MPKMSIQRVRAMRKRQAADLKKRQARAKAAKEKREKAKADKAKADKAKAKKAPAPKKKVAIKKAAVKRREPTKVPPKKVAVKRRAPIKREPPVKDKGQRGAPTKVPEEYGGKQAPITKGQTTPSKEPQSTEDLLRQYNESQGAKDFGLSATYDEETGEYVADVSAFGFEGDKATKRYTPEEFSRVLSGGDDAVQEDAQEPEQQEAAQTGQASLLEPAGAGQQQRAPSPKDEGRGAPPSPTRGGGRDFDAGRGVRFKEQQIQPEQEGGGLARPGQLKTDLQGLHAGLRGTGGGSPDTAGLQQPQVEGQRFPRAKAVIEGGREILDKPRGKEGTTLRERFRETPGAKTIGTAVDIGRGAADLFTRDEKREERQDTRAGRRLEREERRAERRADPTATTTTEGVEYEPQGEVVPREGPPDRPWETGRHGSFVEEYTPMKATLDQGTGYNQPAGPVTGGVELPMEYQGSNQYGGPTAGDSGYGPTSGGSTAGGLSGSTGGGNYPLGVVPGTNVAPDVGTGAAPQPVIEDTTNVTTGADAAAGDTQTTTGDTSGTTGASDTGVTVANGGGGEPPVGDEDPPVGEEPPVDDGTGTDITSRVERTGARTEALAQKEGPFAGPPALAGKAPDYEALARKYNESQGAKDFGLNVTFDPETGEFVEDISAFGFEGDQATKRYSPEDFAKKMGTTVEDLGQVDDPSLQTQDEKIQELDAYDDITPPTDVTPDQMTTAQGAVKEAVARGDIDPANYEAALARELAAIVPAVGAKPEEAVVEEIRALTEPAKAAKRDAEQEEAAKMTAAERPEAKDYAVGEEGEAAEMAEVAGPGVTTREGDQIVGTERADILSQVTGTGTDLDALPAYEKAAARTAQVGEAAQRIAQDLGTSPSVDLEGRQAITGTAPQGDAAQIGGVPTFAASSMEAVTGADRSVAAADMMEVVANLPPAITAAAAEDPATVAAQIDSGDDPQVTAAVAALPEEALVSVQMGKLLEGMEEGTTPAWARPAVAQVEQMMAARGMSASTVGRDALFNAIIQSALPMAQSNAQALQQRAQQNLSNEQQANLASAQNTMQVRMQNLSNRQTAASQTANMAQQIKVQQGQFKQEAVMTTAQQQQQTRMSNTQAAQQRASQESSQQQQAALAQLDTNSRMDLANLQALNAAGRENLNAEQQGRLTEYNAKVARNMRQAELTQDMEKANLDSSLKMELTNLSEQNAAARDTMTAENQERLTNLNTLVDFKKTNANLAQQMDMANMNAEQQMEMAMLAERAATDSANFTADNQFRLQELNNYVTVMSQNTELLSRAEMAKMSASEKISLANLTARNQADSESMSAQNVADLTQYQKKMEASQVNANLAQQMGLANLNNAQDAAMYNAQIDANMDIKQFDANQQASLANSQFMQSMTVKDFDARQTEAMQNATAMANLDMATVDQRTKLSITNANNFLAMDMANLNNEQQGVVMDAQLEQQRLLSDQSAENASLQFNATSDNQVNEFNNSLATQMRQFNASQANSMEQFNTAETNRMEAIAAGNTLDADKFNNQIGSQLAMFDKDQDYRRDAWNAANAQAVEQSNIQWRRNANTINTAAQNEVNRQNAAYSFAMTKDAQSAMWQELRDQATFDFQSGETQSDRIVNTLVSAMGNDNFWSYMGGDEFSELRDGLKGLATHLFGEDVFDITG